MSEKEIYIYDDESFQSYIRESDNVARWEETKKVKKIIFAITRNDVEDLRRLLDSPKWYYIVDKDGYGLLYIAVYLDSRKCFDYILTLPGFPLNIRGNNGQTALMTAIELIGRDSTNSETIIISDVALELLKKGADIFGQDYQGRTTLIHAAPMRNMKIAKILIERGIDLDVQDCYKDTALHVASNFNSSSSFEFAALLLCNGADPRVQDKDGLIPFEIAALNCGISRFHETLFNYTYDCYTEKKTYLSVLLRLAKHRSFVINCFDSVHEVDITPDSWNYYSPALFSLEIDFLNLLLKRFRSAIKNILPEVTFQYPERPFFTCDKVEVFLKKGLKKQMIARIQEENGDEFLDYLTRICRYNEEQTTETMYYLLSYGLEISEKSLQIVYEKFGCCELFNMLLHMDFEKNSECKKQIMPTLLYDVHFTLEEYLKNPDAFSEEDVDRLLCYFNNTELKELCCRLFGEKISSRNENLPQVPRLTELARNVFRKYLIEWFQIKNSRSFYTLLRCLNISDVYRKIITYETVLY